MPFQQSEQDISLIKSIAECRILSVSQLASLHQRNPRALLRRVNLLESKGLLQLSARQFARKRGRPEALIASAPEGINLLKQAKILPKNMPMEDVLADDIHCVEHTLLLNEFRIQVAQLTRESPMMSHQFISHLSPFAPRDDAGRLFVHEFVHFKENVIPPRGFTPDGVLSLTHAGQQKTVLF